MSVKSSYVWHNPITCCTQGQTGYFTPLPYSCEVSPPPCLSAFIQTLGEGNCSLTCQEINSGKKAKLAKQGPSTTGGIAWTEHEDFSSAASCCSTQSTTSRPTHTMRGKHPITRFLGFGWSLLKSKKLKAFPCKTGDKTSYSLLESFTLLSEQFIPFSPLEEFEILSKQI